MAGSTLGDLFTITTWGESHGAAIGVVIDGCPAGLSLDETDIQIFLDRRKPGQSRFTTARKEADQARILSGVFEGKTTGTPISIMIENTDHHSADYSAIKDVYRPGHADYTFDAKYGFRDYRGGGRSSGRETIGRVAAGSVAAKILKELGISVHAYTRSIGKIVIPESEYHYSEIEENKLYMPNNEYAQKASAYLDECIHSQDSSGGTIECIVTGMPAGIGEPVFHKLDAALAGAIMSVGAVKGVEIGDGFLASLSKGSKNNDPFYMNGTTIEKASNHSGGILGGMSDGSKIVIRAAIKPTPSISQGQETVKKSDTSSLENTTISIKGRHDPVIVPRAVVVIEAMTAVTILDLIMHNMTSRMDSLIKFYQC
ncbi:MAG: chorismate synthase [Lachnospiraceae bacterium]|nr:chorismate synthase [Lachnospiraceae bacterium]